MVIDKKTVYKIADLSRIAIEETEIDALTQEMSKVLTFMAKLNELDTEGVEPLVYMNEGVNVWREDIAKNEMSATDGVKNAALHNERFFLVPKIIEK